MIVIAHIYDDSGNKVGEKASCDHSCPWLFILISAMALASFVLFLSQAAGANGWT